ncbi:MAG: CDP-alcohol phosphatidyltransferase family protein [Gemmatimonadaceae bacterium]
MNLPNALTVGRIAAAPFIGVLPFFPSSSIRFSAFLLFVVAAATDYVDGHLARTRNSVTDTGRLLDPLADKLLLFATLVPMSILMAGRANWMAPLLDRTGEASHFAFMTPIGSVPLPWWVVLIIVSREVFMMLFRQAAARRGHVISAIGPAKWKTGFQSLWVGSAFFWFGARTLAGERGWNSTPWHAFELFNGTVGAVAMVTAVVLTVYSLSLYVRHYGRVFVGQTH